MIAQAARYVAAKLARSAVVLTAVGSMAGYGTHWVDLRGSLPTNGRYPRRNIESIEGAVVHHSATKAQSIYSIAQYHTMVNGWRGIAYHIAIGYDGVVYQLNDLESISTHAKGYNSRTIGVVLIGNYHEREMTNEMKSALIGVLEELGDTYKLKFVWAHRDARKTACPGKYAYEFLRSYLYGPKPPVKY